jgi:hypothetical protein
MYVLVLAKAPVPGQVKTRLCPPCTPEEAACLAEAALSDTLAAASAATPNVVLALDGNPDGWVPPDVKVVPQGDGTLGERLATAWSHVPGPAVQIGMDTPHVSAEDLVQAYRTLDRPDVDAVLGPADDGGWWLIGLPHSIPEAFQGVPMSAPDTGDLQHRRLLELGLRVALLDRRNDVDTIVDAREVATLAPHTRFAATFRQLGH